LNNTIQEDNHNKWKITRKSRRNNSENYNQDKQYSIQKQKLNLSLNKGPKRLSNTAQNSFIDSFMLNKPTKKIRPKSVGVIKRKIPFKKLSINIQKNRKSKLTIPKIKSLSKKKSHSNLKNPFTPKFSILSKLKKVININMNSVCKKYLTPFVKEIESINSKFLNLKEIGRGSYAIAYSGICKSTNKDVVIKELKLSKLSKISKIKRFMVAPLKTN
jgi:hypothetical protein